MVRTYVPKAEKCNINEEEGKAEVMSNTST